MVFITHGRDFLLLNGAIHIHFIIIIFIINEKKIISVFDFGTDSNQSVLSIPVAKTPFPTTNNPFSTISKSGKQYNIMNRMKAKEMWNRYFNREYRKLRFLFCRKILIKHIRRL
jgi:hypothetical protein